MATAFEAAGAASLLGGPNAAGVRLISSDQIVMFELYARVVLPIDGYVFWVKATELSDSALLNSSPLNTYQLNQPYLGPVPPDTITVASRPSAVLNTGPANSFYANESQDQVEEEISQPKVPPRTFNARGSLHYATDTRQDEVATYSVNRVVFTALEPIVDLNAIGNDLLYIATFDLPEPFDSLAPANVTPIKFAFGTRGSYYKQAELWHYRGDAVYSFMTTQVVDDARVLRDLQIVSNSLPAWLAFNQYNPAWPVPVRRPTITLYPSYLVPDNLEPPYGVIHVSGTDSNQTQPYLDAMTNQYQGAEDEVSLTLYGANNDAAQSMLYSLLQYSFDTERFGLMNMPVVRDDKQTQSELGVIAQKKNIAFRVSYNQSTMRNVARQLIKSCVPTIYIDNVIAS
jgi:hypothetical protein